VVPCPPFKICAPFHVWPPGCCIHPILYLKMLPPLWFLPPAAKPGDGSEYKPRKFMLRTKAYECAYFSAVASQPLTPGRGGDHS